MRLLSLIISLLGFAAQAAPFVNTASNLFEKQVEKLREDFELHKAVLMNTK